MKELEFRDIKYGRQVIDSEGHLGKISEIDEIHNVIVEFSDGGSGIYCLDKTCLEYDPLYISVK